MCKLDESQTNSIILVDVNLAVMLNHYKFRYMNVSFKLAETRNIKPTKQTLENLFSSSIMAEISDLTYQGEC